jgi:hypothetical protein
MRSNHWIPFGKPGKFSTLVVVVSCPPAATPPAINPSKSRGLRLALAAYMAAVCPAGPEPIMIIFSIMNIEMLKCYIDKMKSR